MTPARHTKSFHLFPNHYFNISGLLPCCKNGKKICALFGGPLFLGAPVRPNMLNMPKSASGWKSTCRREFVCLTATRRVAVSQCRPSGVWTLLVGIVNRPKGVVRGHVTYFLKFWNPLHISPIRFIISLFKHLAKTTRRHVAEIM